MKTTVTTSVGGRQVTIETGRLAKQADGSVVVSCGNNIVLVTAVASRKETTLDYFPLMVEYQEKFYATGKIPGGYFKREGKPTTDAVLTARLIDRPIRPKFPEGFRCETQVVATVLSADGAFPIEILASVGASAALHVSDIPFEGSRAGRTRRWAIGGQSHATTNGAIGSGHHRRRDSPRDSDGGRRSETDQ
jgi:polyribonucleotide nucleotidyltransferase